MEPDANAIDEKDGDEKEHEKLVFQNIKSIETIGQVNCLLLELQMNDSKRSKNILERSNSHISPANEKLINSICYLKKCKGFKDKSKVIDLIICSQDSFEEVEMNLIEPVSKNNVNKF